MTQQETQLDKKITFDFESLLGHTKSFGIKKEIVKCNRCGVEMKKYIPGIGSLCRCQNCGYKDPCCE